MQTRSRNERISVWHWLSALVSSTPQPYCGHWAGKGTQKHLHIPGIQQILRRLLGPQRARAHAGRPFPCCSYRGMSWYSVDSGLASYSHLGTLKKRPTGELTVV